MNGTVFPRLCRLSLLFFSAASLALPQDPAPSVSFHYAFAPPHRITVALPDSSNKTLLDAMPGKLLMSWTYENLIYYSFNSYSYPPTKWKVVIEPQIDGHPFAQSKWERARGYLPVLKNTYHDGGASPWSWQVELRRPLAKSRWRIPALRMTP